MPVICSLIEHGFFPVFSMARKVMLYSNGIYTTIFDIMSIFGSSEKSLARRKNWHDVIVLHRLILGEAEV